MLPLRILDLSGPTYCDSEREAACVYEWVSVHKCGALFGGVLARSFHGHPECCGVQAATVWRIPHIRAGTAAAQGFRVVPAGLYPGF